MPLVLPARRGLRGGETRRGIQVGARRIAAPLCGAPSRFISPERMTADLDGARIWLEARRFSITPAHTRSTIAWVRCCFARRMGKTRIIAETGAGQHGVATATVAARFGFPASFIWAPSTWSARSPNVFRMRLLGAEVREVTSGSKTLKDAMNEALRDWVANVDDTFYIIGSVAGPHPYPAMVRDFQTIIGEETRHRFSKRRSVCPIFSSPAWAAARMRSVCFILFSTTTRSRFTASRRPAPARKLCATRRHWAKVFPGVLHGARSYLLQTPDGQVVEAHSISAGLDYPGVGPEHSWLKDQGRVKYFSATDREALDAFAALSRQEGIIPALEPAHALAHVMRVAPRMAKDSIIVMALSGRGDKDVFTVASALGEQL